MEKLVNIKLLFDCYLENSKQDSWEWFDPFGYRHPNGFIKLVIGKDKDGRKLVIHMWEHDHIYEHGDIHNHRWDFHSLTLQGCVEHNIYNIAKETGVFNYFQYFPTQVIGGDASLKFNKGKINLDMITKFVVPKGSMVYVNKKALHSISITKGRTITLVLQSSPVRSFTDVFTLKNHPANIKNLHIEWLNNNKAISALDEIKHIANKTMFTGEVGHV